MIRARIGPQILLMMLLVSSSWGLTNGPAPWVALGPDGGDARRIVPDPKDHSHLYLGTVNGWMYESHNSGSNWARLAQVGKRDDLVLDSILVDPLDSHHVVVGAWVIDRPDGGGGLYYTFDGGITWSNQAEMRGQSVLSLSESVSHPNVMVAGTLEGIFRSTDGGMRWKRISPADNKEIHDVQSVAIDPHDPEIIYAGTWHLPWKTTDAGQHWDSIKQGIIDDSDVFSIIVDPISPRTVFASACSGIYKSDDAGALFHKIQGIPTSARRTRRLLQDPHHLETIFAGTTEGLYRSGDAGKNWQRITGGEIIVNDVVVDLADARRVLIATDRSGVMASDDGGDTFHSSNAGFSSRQVTALKRDSTHAQTVFVGVVNDKDWGGVFESENGGQNWIQRSDGLEGRDVFSIGQAPDGTMIAGTSHGIFRLDRTAEAWESVKSAPGMPRSAEAAPVVSIRKPMTVAGKVSLRGNASASKAKLGKLTAAQTRTKQAAEKKKSAVDPHPPVLVVTTPTVFDGSVYSIATAGERLLATTSIGMLASTDEGVSWSATGPDDKAEWRFLAAAGNQVVAASLHQSAVSSDGGIAWEEVKLPASLSQISTIAIIPSGEVWVGGREGIFVSSDLGGTWSVPKDLFLKAVTNIFYDDATDRLTITTNSNSNIVFTVLLPGKQVNFTDAGWDLRFARPMGDHMIAATLFDGIVVQPHMVRSPVAMPVPARAAALAGPSAAKQD